MSGYEVVLDQLTAAGDAAVGAGDQAGRVDLAEAVADVPSALPGARSAAAIGQVADLWAGQVAAWRDAARALGEQMREAARAYADSDADAERDLRVPASRLGPL
ncbi:hypothetical protein [Actinokineospora sp. UTMC 2448]|uniref:hypothetical protein n=1 Tax=Actinokineospora sp. UTMC 2448 TaxID=2268449 RepID=UPI002164EDF7|nr:hypothetical protein [Actinokineospora sp. UTMC 2448]UVS81677.1 hypothetical protein Actkin_05441 [Actinokineospora sp. UTMC 2448]